ncbi:MAG: T3SS effector HopA1 family protein, partial [Myxococcota bacterium]|nr:T3SS effector HopA1 family protein [Myxococcota bacterium]
LHADPTLAKLYLDSRGLDKLPAEISVEMGRDLRDWFRDSLLPGKSGMDTLSLVQRQGQAAKKLKDKLVESVPGLNAQRIDAVLKRHFTDPAAKDAVTIELVSKLSGTNAEAVKKFFAQPENRLLLEKPAEFDVVPATRLQDLPEVKTSRASLDDMLKTIWGQPDAAWDKNSIYRLYNRASEANPLKALRPEAYASRLGDIASARPSDAISNVQSGFLASEYNGISQALAAAKNGDVDVARLHSTFFRFERANWQPETIRERVYINARADHAPEVMDFVVKEIIDNPGKFPGVEMAKISGAAAVSGRSENIVIYTSGDEATTRVLDAIASYTESKPNHFMKSTPMLTDGKALGVATGAEPSGDLGGRYSFGSLRAEAISKALAEAKHRGASEAEFISLVEDNFRALGVDPEAPHRNLRESGD